MKTRFKIWAFCVMMVLLGYAGIAVIQENVVLVPRVSQGELTSKDNSTPFSHETSQMLSAPAQLPAIVPSQGSRLLTPVKYRTTLTRTNILRRTANRLCDNIYTPLAKSGQFVVERVSSPLHKCRVVNYYVITLCRLLC